MISPHKVTELFEESLSEYCGSRYAVAVTSCTSALLLACSYHVQNDRTKVHVFSIPKRTYVSVPQSIINAGGKVSFRDEDWTGMYQLHPYNIWDSARLLTSNMYKAGSLMCLSFHWTKTLSIGQGGAILTDDIEIRDWLRRARFDGRNAGVHPEDDYFSLIGQHCYMSPRDAAEGLNRLAILPRKNVCLPNSNYPDLSKFEVFNAVSF